jgi:hypothetical protein
MCLEHTGGPLSISPVSIVFGYVLTTGVAAGMEETSALVAGPHF